MSAGNSALLAFLEEYISQLADLTSAVKAKINSLTMLAAETAADSPAAAPSIVAAIEKRILSVRSQEAGPPAQHTLIIHIPYALHRASQKENQPHPIVFSEICLGLFLAF